MLSGADRWRCKLQGTECVAWELLPEQEFGLELVQVPHTRVLQSS